MAELEDPLNLGVSRHLHFWERLARVEEQLVAQRIAVEAAFKAALLANEKYERSNEARLALLNEFRAQSSDQAKMYVQQAVLTPELNALKDKLNMVGAAVTVIQSKGLGANQAWLYFATITGVLFGFTSLVLTLIRTA